MTPLENAFREYPLEIPILCQPEKQVLNSTSICCTTTTKYLNRPYFALKGVNKYDIVYICPVAALVEGIIYSEKKGSYHSVSSLIMKPANKKYNKRIKEEKVPCDLFDLKISVITTHQTKKLAKIQYL
jgi:hypothetical protein